MARKRKTKLHATYQVAFPDIDSGYYPTPMKSGDIRFIQSEGEFSPTHKAFFFTTEKKAELFASMVMGYVMKWIDIATSHVEKDFSAFRILYKSDGKFSERCEEALRDEIPHNGCYRDNSIMFSDLESGRKFAKVYSACLDLINDGIEVLPDKVQEDNQPIKIAQYKRGVIRNMSIEPNEDGDLQCVVSILEVNDGEHELKTLKMPDVPISKLSKLNKAVSKFRVNSEIFYPCEFVEKKDELVEFVGFIDKVVFKV